MSNSDSSSTPAIRGFQFDSGAIGNLKNSVNLFRGDVNFQQKLLNLTARPGKQELDIDISIIYQSNVHDQTQRWNRDAATGVLGLGWAMSLEGIGMNRPSALSPATKSYYYQVNGSKNNLVRELGDNPYRFSMSTTFTPVAGNPIGVAMQAQFAAHGIVIDAQAMASETGSDSWLISDDENQQLFEVKANTNNDSLEVYDGGESYQLQSYSFWKILYYPVYERWLVVRESGTSYSYGGFNAQSDKNKHGYNYSQGNSIQWAVGWTDPNDSDKLVWTGSSSVSTNNSQTQYAKAWSLASITDRWGDRVLYEYNQFGPDGDYASYSDQWRDEVADLIPVVEQQVGVNGLPYTKAFYLTSITDSFDRKVIFNYGDKDYTVYTGSTSAASAREYLDPHRDLEQQVVASEPDTWPSPNAYQDCYETKFLTTVEVQNSATELMFSIGFTYENVVSSYAGYNSDDRLYGDTAKRQLKGITQFNEKGETLLQTAGAELAFEYHDTAAKSPGALASITYPDGGVAHYSYDELALDICDRKITITPPSELGSAASPRVFYGEDYVVSIWTNSALNKLSMRVYTWLGHWEVWQVDDLQSGSLLYDNPAGSIHVSGSSGNLLNVKIAGSYFVVSFSDGNEVQAYAFSKSLTQPGQWTPYSNNNNASVVCNQPSATWPASSDLKFLVGGSWFLALETTASQKRNLFRYTYRWAEKLSGQWQRNHWTAEQIINGTDDVIYLGTANDCYFQLSYANSQATATLNWFDAQLNWQAGGSQTVSDFYLPQQDNAISIMGESFAVFSNQTRNPSSSYVYYDVRVFQWDVDYQFIDLKWDGGAVATTVPMSLEDRIGRQGATPSIVPTVVSNSLFACAGNVFRFDGQTWWSRTATDGLPIDSNASYVSYAYGEDYAVQGWVDNNTPKGNLIAYDPNSNGGSLQWNNTEVSVMGLPPSTPSYDPAYSNWATSGNSDFLTVGANVYYRDFSSNWETQVSEAGYTILFAEGFQLNSTAMNDQAPSFMAYFEYKPGASGDATVGALLLKNGQVADTQSFAGEKYYTASESNSYQGNGLNPAGPNSLVTYPNSVAGFQDAQSIYLYRYAGQALSGAITHRAVVSIEIDNGCGQNTGTAYEYDPNTAACDVSGHVIKYYEAKTYPGCLEPSAQKNGYTNQQYINGLVALEIDNIPNGAVISWNDGGEQFSYTANKNADRKTINNMTNTVLQSLTLNTPVEVVLSFVYGTSEFTEGFTQTNTTVSLFETLPAPPINNFQMLDGMLWRTQTYASIDEGFKLVASQENTWQPYIYRAGDLLDPNVPNYPLSGGLVFQTIKENMADGSVKTEVSDYIPEGFSAPASGQLVKKSVAYLDGDGREQVATETTTFAYEYYESFRCLHGYTAVVQKVSRQNQVVSGASADVFSNATAATGVTVPAKSNTFKFMGGQFSDFPFETYEYSDPESWQNWLKTNEVTVITAEGLVVNSQDASGVNHGLLYDELKQITIANVHNAFFSPTETDTVFEGANFPVGETAYNGFESYENQSGWILTGGAIIEADTDNTACDCHTGDRSLKLPHNGGFSRNIQITESNQTYLLGFWYKTDADFTDGGLMVSNSAGYTSHPTNAVFSNTNGSWLFQTVGINVADAIAENVTFSWHNSGTSDVLIDDVIIMPMQADCSSQVYDPTFKNIEATHIAPGKTSRLLHNRFHQQIGDVTYENQVKSLNVDFRSRQGDGSFDADSPNARLSLAAAAGAVAADFKDGGKFAEQFDISNLTTNWQLQGNNILHISEDSDQMTSLPFECAEVVTSVAMYVEISDLSPSQIISEPFSLSVGEYQFTWTPATKQWSGIGPVTIIDVGQSHNPRNMLFIRGNGLLALFADGQFIGSYSDQVAGDQVTFSTGNNQMQINQLIAIANPRLQIDYSDGTGKTIQTQALHGRDCYVAQAIHDDAGRDVVVTKPMPYSFQNTHGLNNTAQQILQFRQGMVDMTTFLSSLEGSGLMSGDVADFYTGDSAAVQSWQNEVSAWPGPISYGYTPTDDSGYPYTRKRYEASPLARVVEKGQPGTLSDGTLLAINMLTPVSERSTVQYEFGYEEALFELPEPFASTPDAYKVTSEIQPLKSRQVQIKDQQDNVVSTLVYDQESQNPREYTQSFTTYSIQGSVLINRTPNYFSANPERQSEFFQTTHELNLAGLPVNIHEADTGTTLFMYDALGRLRFEMPDQTNQNNPYIKYNCYNNLSQVTSNGTIDANTYPWDCLGAYVLDEAWPSADISQCSRELRYNDLGNSEMAPPVNEVGQVVEVLTHNYRYINNSEVVFTVTEQFTYTINGSIMSTTQSIVEKLDADHNSVGPEEGYQVNYQYNNLQQPISMSYPVSLGETISYQYDELGREVSRNYGEVIKAGYQYIADDSPANMVLQGSIGNNLNQMMAVNYSYISPGLLHSGESTSNQDVGINVGSYNYNANGKVLSKDLAFELPRYDNDQPYCYDMDQNFTYDEAVGRLNSSQDVNNPEFDISDLSYDDNGNILALSEGGNPVEWSFENNQNPQGRTDLLSGISSSSTEILNNKSGQMIQSPNYTSESKTNTITYDNSLGLTANISYDTDSQLTFIYGSQGQRVMKQADTVSSTSRILYVSPGSHYLSEIMLDENPKITNYIYGQKQGLLGITVDGDARFPVSDQLGTVMAWIDAEEKIISSYQFSAFGKIQSENQFGINECPVIYAGQIYEAETGLYDFRSRFYDPELRRFISPDAQREYASPYTYVGNNPISKNDPSGEMSNDAIGGLILSQAEIYLATFTMQFWALPIGYAGMANSISHKDAQGKEFWKNYAYSEIGTAVAVAEISAGVALTAVTGGAAGAVAGAILIGAGVSAASYSAFHEGDFDIKQYVKATGIGAVSGLITAGTGALGGAVLGTSLAAQVTSGVVGGVLSSGAASGINYLCDPDSVNWKSAGINAVLSGALGVVGAYGANKMAGRVSQQSVIEVLEENKATGARKFLLGEAGTVVTKNNDGAIYVDPNRIASLAKPVAFNTKKPITAGLNVFFPATSEWV